MFQIIVILFSIVKLQLIGHDSFISLILNQPIVELFTTLVRF